ncbi:hypothetical protein [Streptomyces albus]|uniref:hypothetical protein n=1 Tax=Streptomyces albus TaxID=1888 RepID=UPI0006B5CF79|nr:hypothetical protein [Streptomyces albus]GHJ22975.1 hypothetical protein TPA0909_45890 [Streptomyces albus]
MTLTPYSYTEISDLLDHTDICRLLDDDTTTRLLGASNQPTPAAPPAETDPAVPARPANDAAYMAALWQHIRACEQKKSTEAFAAPPQAPAWARPAPAAAPAVPAWVWRYSALALSTGGAIGLAGWGIGQTAAWGPYLEEALYALAAVVIGGAACAMAAASVLRKLIGAFRARLERPQITQHVHSSGFLARANGSVHIDNR